MFLSTLNFKPLLPFNPETTAFNTKFLNPARYYRQLYDLNKDLVAEHDKRATNHAELLKHLKEVNLMIQRAARLRAGGPKTRVVTACRTAIKNTNMPALFKIIKDGDGPV